MADKLQHAGGIFQANLPAKRFLEHVSFGLQYLKMHMIMSQGVHSSSTVNIHVRAQKGYYLE